VSSKFTLERSYSISNVNKMQKKLPDSQFSIFTLKCAFHGYSILELTLDLMTETISKVAFITGGGTGVGKATTLQLAARGYAVIVNYSKSEADALATVQAAQALGVKATAYMGDVSDNLQVMHMLEKCRQEFGRLDLLVNNAATTYFIEHTDLESMSEDKWDRILAVNLKGPFFMCRAAIPLMREQGGGAIVNVASVAGLAGAGSCIAYAASKGGLITMTKSLAKAFAPDIRVNAVCPGVIISRWLEEHPEMIAGAIPVTPLQRASSTNDIANAIVFLGCDAHMMTGQALVVDGGRTM
jgi:3-oxoacyl-[acyl-carrier protein] reductase